MRKPIKIAQEGTGVNATYKVSLRNHTNFEGGIMKSTMKHANTVGAGFARPNRRPNRRVDGRANPAPTGDISDNYPRCIMGAKMGGAKPMNNEL